MLTLLGINKILAIYVGPSGYAAIGQFQNAVQVITAIAGGAINTGVTRYTAQYQEDENKQHIVWRTAGTVFVVGSVLVGMAISIFNKQLSLWFFHTKDFEDVFLWFAATLLMFSLNSYFLSILNGNGQLERYALSNIAGSLISGVVTSVLAINGGLHGALIGLAVYQSLAFFVTLGLCYRLRWFKWKNLFGRINNGAANDLTQYALMSLTTAACGPVTYILIRDHIIEKFGISSAGYWEAGMRMSSAYLLFFTTTLSIYFLPKIASVKDTSLIKSLLFKDYKIIALFSIIASIPIYYFRENLITLLFASIFLPAAELMLYIIIADNIKIAAWAISYTLIARGATKIFIVGEVAFSISYYMIALILASHFGLIGVVVAGVLNSALYLTYVYFGMNYFLRVSSVY